MALSPGRIGGLLLKYWYITIRRLDRVFDVFYWPLIGLLLWGFTMAYLEGQVANSAAINFLLGGTILWTFFLRTQQDVAVYLLEDFWNNSLYNYFASPLTSGEVGISIVLFGLLRSVVAFFYLVALAILMYSYNLLALGWIKVAAMSAGLVVFGCSTGLLIAGLIFRRGQSIQVFAWSVGWLIQPFSAVFYPLASLPGWALPLAKALPTSYIFEGMRAAISGEAVAGLLLKSLGLNIVYLVLSTWFFVRSIERAREKGILTRVT